ETTENLVIQQAAVSGVIVSEGRVGGVQTDFGVTFRSNAVVITAGTFLRGLLHVGEHQKPGGRMADTSSGLSQNLRELGFDVGRFKTGTPCRISGRSIEFSKCQVQQGEEPPPRFSYDRQIARGPNDV